MTIHGAGFSARSGAGNNDKTTVAGKGYFVGNVPSSSRASHRYRSLDYQRVRSSASDIERAVAFLGSLSPVPTR